MTPDTATAALGEAPPSEVRSAAEQTDISTVTRQADFLARSDERDMWLRRLDDTWRDGWAACAAALSNQYERGFADGVMAHKHAQHDAARLTETEARRWTLRGEPRTRETFGLPHPDDFPGRGRAAA